MYTNFKPNTHIKTTKLSIVLFLSLFLFSLLSCSSDDDKLSPFVIEQTELEVRLNLNETIRIEKGNGNYKVTIDDPEIVDASVSYSQMDNCNYVHLSGKHKGATSVWVTDTASDEQIELKTTIVDLYLGATINPNEHELFSETGTLFLVYSSPVPSFYMAASDDQKPICKGTFRYHEEEETKTPVLTFYFFTENEGSHAVQFNISESTPALISLLGFYSSDVSLATGKSAGDTPALPLQLRMKEIGKEAAPTVIGTVNPNIRMPHGTLN